MVKKLYSILGFLFLSFVNLSWSDTLSLEQVATQALKESYHAYNGQLWEYGGIIYSRDGVVKFTQPPITIQSIDFNSVNPELLLIPDDQLLALYHTHPCASKTHYPGYFSQIDLITPFYFNVPAFILDQCTGLVHEFKPHVDHIFDNGKDVKNFDDSLPQETYHIPVGRIVGDIEEHAPDLDQ